MDKAISEDAAAWIVHVASLAKRSKGATQSIGGTVIDSVLLDEIQTEQVVELGPQLVAMKAWDALGFTPILNNLGMNPTAIATAQVMISNLFTNTHFEGVCAKNPKAKHGKNKQKRSDCRQVAVGMAFDENGFPHAHEVFAGNISSPRVAMRGTGKRCAACCGRTVW